LQKVEVAEPKDEKMADADEAPAPEADGPEDPIPASTDTSEPMET